MIFGSFAGGYDHVVAFIQDNEGSFRLYDNDAPERLRGTYQTMRADEITAIEGAMMTIVAVVSAGTELSVRMGSAITTLQRRERRVRQRTE